MFITTFKIEISPVHASSILGGGNSENVYGSVRGCGTSASTKKLVVLAAMVNHNSMALLNLVPSQFFNNVFSNFASS